MEGDGEGGKLINLPLEILVNILGFLDLESINQLERVCALLQDLITNSLQAMYSFR